MSNTKKSTADMIRNHNNVMFYFCILTFAWVVVLVYMMRWEEVFHQSFNLNGLDRDTQRFYVSIANYNRMLALTQFVKLMTILLFAVIASGLLAMVYCLLNDKASAEAADAKLASDGNAIKDACVRISIVNK